MSRRVSRWRRRDILRRVRKKKGKLGKYRETGRQGEIDCG
jgi:hypothetical protein